jgi:hypothetical protein
VLAVYVLRDTKKHVSLVPWWKFWVHLWNDLLASRASSVTVVSHSLRFLCEAKKENKGIRINLKKRANKASIRIQESEKGPKIIGVWRSRSRIYIKLSSIHAASMSYLCSALSITKWHLLLTCVTFAEFYPPQEQLQLHHRDSIKPSCSVIVPRLLWAKLKSASFNVQPRVYVILQVHNLAWKDWTYEFCLTESEKYQVLGWRPNYLLK